MKFFKQDPLENAISRLKENQIYEIVTLEVMNEEVMPGVWGKAFSDSEGNIEKTKALLSTSKKASMLQFMIIFNKKILSNY